MWILIGVLGNSGRDHLRGHYDNESWKEGPGKVKEGWFINLWSENESVVCVCVCYVCYTCIRNVWLWPADLTLEDRKQVLDLAKVKVWRYWKALSLMQNSDSLYHQGFSFSDLVWGPWSPHIFYLWSIMGLLWDYRSNFLSPRKKRWVKHLRSLSASSCCHHGISVPYPMTFANPGYSYFLP